MDWQLVKNTSWDADQKIRFGEKNLGEGYVICTRDRYRQLIAIASIHQGFKVPPENVKKVAVLMVNAPRMLELIQELAAQGCQKSSKFLSDFQEEQKQIK